jgi:rhodanese-related sulfurtransferase
MAPLVPDLIGNELNLIVAFLVGIAFGFILEQAGFSSSKKLVGLFYGYDFTVLRVFFTAGITAMTGIIIFTHYGLLDINLVYINPTFLWSALIGGGIMGLGFVIGGYCPGTSFCAAATGKMDAMVFIVGSFAGVFLFGELYPLLENIYMAEAWGYERIFETLNISQGLFAFLLIIIAIGAFIATTVIETRTNGKPNPELANKKVYLGISAAVVLMGIIVFYLPNQKDYYLDKLQSGNYVESYDVKMVSADELAFRIINNKSEINIIDLREEADFKEEPLPSSYNFSMVSLFEKDAKKVLMVRHKRNIFIATDEVTAKKGAIIASELGYVNPSYLKGGYDSFKREILSFTPPEALSGNRNNDDAVKFRIKAALLLPELIKKNKEIPSPVQKSKRIIGGC